MAFLANAATSTTPESALRAPLAMAEDEKATLHRQILAWFESEQRDFPWRRLKDPFTVLIAEKLLQQTAARAHLTKAFAHVLQSYPTPHALCNADLADLEHIVAPLGFRYRARELKNLACTLVERYGGEVPLDLCELLSLPGIGDYCARAVLCFAGNQDVPVVDTNIARMLYRLFDIPGPLPANPARKKSLIGLAQPLIPVGKSRKFNLAILDLCAAICTAANPKCVECPILSVCRYGRKNTPERCYNSVPSRSSRPALSEANSSRTKWTDP